MSKAKTIAPASGNMSRATLLSPLLTEIVKIEGQLTLLDCTYSGDLYMAKDEHGNQVLTIFADPKGGIHENDCNS